MGLAASSASANDVWLWACHSPSGKSVSKEPARAQEGDGRWAALGNGCAGDASVSPAGYTLSFAKPDPAAGSSASITFSLPTGTSTKDLKLNHTARGFEGTTGFSYEVNGQKAEGSAIALNASSSTVTLELSCSSNCTGSPAVDIISVASLVSDTKRPEGGVNWNTPVDKEMPITPAFTDEGLGLDRAVVTIEGHPELTKVEYFNGNQCADLTPGDSTPATNDRPLNPAACVNGGQQAGHTEANPLPLLPLTVKLSPDPLALAEGTYTRTVTVYDVAGNPTPVSGSVEVWHPPAPVSVRTLNISTSSVTEQPSGGGNNPPGGGGVQGAQRNQCRSPRLSVTLRSKPVRVSKNVPVLQYKKSYRFTGRLTCVINGKRQSAPKRTKLSIYNKVGKKTVRKPNTAIRSKGAVDLKLAFVSSRTVIFRYTNADGQKSEVKIKVRVTKKKQ